MAFEAKSGFDSFGQQVSPFWGEFDTGQLANLVVLLAHEVFDFPRQSRRYCPDVRTTISEMVTKIREKMDAKNKMRDLDIDFSFYTVLVRELNSNRGIAEGSL